MNTSNRRLGATKTKAMRTGAASYGVLCVMVGLLWTAGLRAQTPEEHASHHPDQAAAATQPDASPAAMPGAMPAGDKPAAGGMGDMGEMMKGMGKPPPKELYPSLMGLPELSPEQRKQVERQADERMHAGAALIARALDALNAGTKSGDYVAMQEATKTLREGEAQLESGIAARRALAEGRAPREVALAWFKREMNLTSSMPHDEPRGLFGVGAFHLFMMGLLIAFALAMLAMYFFKMRRAAALFGRLDPDAQKAPPGSAKPLAAPPAADAKPAPPKSDAKAAPPAGDTKAAPPAGDAKPAPPSDAKPAAPAAPSAAGAKAASPEVAKP